MSEWRATVLCRETAVLSVEDRREVERRPKGDLPSMGDAQVGRAARGLAAQLDPQSVARRASRATAERCVSLRPAPDTMTYLTGLLPVDALMGADKSGELVGHGPVPGSTARAMLAAAREGGAPIWLRRLFAPAEDGQLVAVECSRRLFPGGLRRPDPPRQDLPHSMAMPRSDTPTTSWRLPVAAPRAPPTGQGLCEACNQAREAVGWRARVVEDGLTRAGPAGRHRVRWRTATGHTYDSTARPVLEAGRGEPSRLRGRPGYSWLEHVVEVGLAAA